MEDEKIISNTSYVSKDFNSIYNDLLDLTKNLTNKWDPSSSNESDPGVVLLKLAAIIGDKNNYNIDKNVLECFPLSVTQTGNARKLYDALGYNMHWYVSATTNVTFKLKNNEGLTEDENFTDFQIPTWTTLYDNTGEIAYTTTSPATLYVNNLNTTASVEAKEGICYEYKINESPKITIANLDEDLRLYFTEKQIAENGIYVGNYNDDKNKISYNWTKVENLGLYQPGEKVFQFGVLPNSDTCYIQFPDDVASIMEDGLAIRYFVSTGTNGNIKPRTLRTIGKELVKTLNEGQENEREVSLNDKIAVIQLSSTFNGSDPETLDNAYKNYKKTIGTFETLVTRKDYENWLYNNSSYLSNCLVCDRTSDLNLTNYVQTWLPAHESKVLINVKNSITPYNLIIYALDLPGNNLVEANNQESYEKTFEVISDDTIQDYIKNELEDSKSIQHDIMDLDTLKSISYPNGVAFKALFRNTFKINAQLNTYYKVTTAEAKEIQTNVLDVLYRTYNSRNIDFGTEIDYNKLIEVIKSADSRIKNVSLDIPTYSINKYCWDSTDNVFEVQNLDNNDKNDLIARMILSGNVQLYDFDFSFDYDFGKENIYTFGTNSNHIKSITTEVKINLTNDSVNPYLIKANELIQILKPNYVADKQYSTYVRFTYNGSRTLDKDTIYSLQSGESLVFKYTDSSNLVQTDTYDLEGTLFRVNFDITPISGSYSETLSASDSVELLQEVSSKLTRGTKYYYIINSNEGKLQLDSSHPYYILQEGEYFLYTNSDLNELIILGSGTKLELTKDSNNQYVGSINEQIESPDLTKVQEQDIQNIDWKVLSTNLNLTQMEITNISDNNLIYSSEAIQVDNSLKDLYSQQTPITIYYKTNDPEVIEYSQIKPDFDGELVYIQSRLNINSSTNYPQLLQDTTSKSTQEITLYYEDDTNVTIKNGQQITGYGTITYPLYLTFNNAVILTGGEKQDAAVLTSEGELEYSLIANIYTESANYTLTRDSGGNLLIDKNNWYTWDPTVDEDTSGTYYVYDINTNTYIAKTLPDDYQQNTKYYTYTNNRSITLPFKFTLDALEEWFIPALITVVNNKVQFSITNGNIQIFDKTSGQFTNIDPTGFSGNDSYILKIVPTNSSGATNLTIKLNDPDNVVLLGNIFKVKGLNTKEMNVVYDSNDENSDTKIKADAYSIVASDIYQSIGNILKNSSTSNSTDVSFNFTYVVPDSNKVLKPTLSSSYWNPNHIYNQYTISYIDFEHSSIKVSPYSIK